MPAMSTSFASVQNVSAPSNGSQRSHQVLFSGNALANFELGKERGVTLAGQFAGLGYRTFASLGSGALSVCGTGFDRFSSPGLDDRRSAKQSIDALAEWLDQAKDLPLFAWVQVSEARAPYEPPKQILRRYYPNNIDPFDPTSPVSAFEFAPEWNPLIGDPFYTEALYDGSISALDGQLAQLIAIDRFAQGVIAYVGAHGENLRRAGEFRFGHGNLCKSSLSVPLLIKAPGIEPGTRASAAVSTQDLGRTLLNLLGHDGAAFPGRDLFNAVPADAIARLALSGDSKTIVLLEQPWLLRLDLSVEPTPEQHALALFRLSTDPNCLSDLATQQGTDARRLRNTLVQRMEAASKLAPGSSAALVDPNCPCANCESLR